MPSLNHRCSISTVPDLGRQGIGLAPLAPGSQQPLWLGATPLFRGGNWGNKTCSKNGGFGGAPSPSNHPLRMANANDWIIIYTNGLPHGHMLRILNCQRVAGKYLFVCSHHVATKNKQKIPTETQAGVRIGVQEGEQAHAIMRFKTWSRSWIKGQTWGQPTH